LTKLEYKVSFSYDELHVIKAGVEALRLLQRTRTRSWQMWMVVGAALELLRTKAVEVTATTSVSYNSVFGELLSMFRLKLDSGVRKRLFDLLAHRSEIETWRSSLPPDRAYKLTHPNSVWRAWQAWKASTDVKNPRQAQ
jgi:hypothetical protein